MSLPQFGKLADAYTKARPQYPKKVIDAVFGEIKIVHPTILDLGCGTGIGTRQIAPRSRFTIGCDIDDIMLNEAMRLGGTNLSYALGDASKLPFADNTFDVITIFTALHWFTKKSAATEMKRVLKPAGKICVIQPRHVASFRKDFRVIIEREIGVTIPRVYSQKPFDEFFSENDFVGIKQLSIKTVDSYSLDQLLLLLESYSAWNYVSTKKRPSLRKKLRRHYSQFVKGDKIRETRNIELTFARVPRC